MRISRPIWIAFALLAACSSKPVVWEKTGASEATAQEDKDACHVKARVTPPRRATPPPAPYGATMALSVEDVRVRDEAEAFRDCMEDKGYSAKR